MLGRLQSAVTHARIAQVGCDPGQQLDAREREIAPAEQVVRAAVGAHRLAHRDEEPLAQQCDTLRALSVERLELSLRHLDERRRMSERPQVARIHHAHVLIAAQRCDVPPLLQIDVLRRLRPASLRIEQRAECGQVQPLCLARERVIVSAAFQRFVEAGHRRDQHRAIERIEAHPDEIRVRRRRVGQRRRRVQDLDQLVLLVFGSIVGRPQRADAGRRIGTGLRRVVAETGVPKLGVRATRDGRDRVAPSRGRERRRDDAIRQLQRSHGRCGLARALLETQSGEIGDERDVGARSCGATCRAARLQTR